MGFRLENPAKGAAATPSPPTRMISFFFFGPHRTRSVVLASTAVWLRAGCGSVIISCRYG